MNNRVTGVRADSGNISGQLGRKVHDLKLLFKFRLSMMVVFTSVMAFILASAGMPDMTLLVLLGLGGFLVTGAANALNEVLEKDYDSLMVRTADRPVAAGRMTISEAVLWAGFMSCAGIVLLALVSPWAAFFGMIALVVYAFIYTPVKRISPIAVAIGAIPGALPMLIGASAAEGYISSFALLLFGIQFFWQFPHFWSIGWLGFEDYRNAGYKLVPSSDDKPDKKTGLYSFVYALALLPVVLALPISGGGVSWLAAGLIAVTSAGYAVYGWKLYRNNDRKSALRLMFASFAYLPLVLMLLLGSKIM